MEASVQQFSVDKKCLEIAKKEILLENDRLLQKIMSQDVLLTVMNSMSLNNDFVNMEMQECESCEKCLNLNADLSKSKQAYNDLLKNYSQLEKYWKEIVENVVHTPSATTIALGMFKLDLVPFPPRLLQNRDVHIDYLRHTQEQANTLRELVKQAKSKQPLDRELDFSCKYATRIQELLVYVQDTCPIAVTPSTKKVVVSPMNNVKKVSFDEPLTSSSNIKQVESSNTSDSNTHVLSSTKVVQIVLWYLDSGYSKHMTGNCSQLMNFVSKFLGTVRFGNNQIARIMGYGDYHLGNVVISRVYYVEGLGHNLFLLDNFVMRILKLHFGKTHALFAI
ncbi:hypothetical protein Tco_0615882 [Tanacetum coccineum]